MNTTIIKSILAVVVVGGIIVAGYVYLPSLLNENSDSIPTPTDITSDSTTELNNGLGSDQAGQTSLQEKKDYFSKVVAEGGAHQCRVSQTVNGVKAEGTVYIKDKQVRGDFTAQSTGLNLKVMFISDSKFAYTWTSLSNKGFKLPVKSDSGSVSTGTQFNYDDITDYECKSWTPDNSKFIIPSTITFSEVK